MKRFVSYLLIAVMLLGSLTACSAPGQSETTQPTEQTQLPPESPEEADVLKIMILGSSRSIDTFQMLYEVFKDQMPQQKLVLGIMYYSGCSMSMHANFIKNNEYVYKYYRNDSGRWDILSDVNMDMGLKDQNWDVVLLQAGNGDTRNSMNLETRKFLRDYVDKLVKHPHQLWWHSTWFNSTDPVLYKAPKTAEDAAAVDQIAQLRETNEAAKAYVLNDPMFSGHVASGTPVMYALKHLHIPETELFGDHTHLTDFGYLLVGYSFYAQFTGNPVTQIHLDSVPAHLRHGAKRPFGDLQVTEEMKQMIIETVDYTAKDPWSVPTE